METKQIVKWVQSKEVVKQYLIRLLLSSLIQNIKMIWSQEVQMANFIFGKDQVAQNNSLILQTEL